MLKECINLGSDFLNGGILFVAKATFLWDKEYYKVKIPHSLVTSSSSDV